MEAASSNFNTNTAPVNATSTYGPAFNFVQNNAPTNIICQTQRTFDQSEEEKNRRIINDLRCKLKDNYSSLPMRTIPWLDKELTIEDHYIDLCLVTEDISGRERKQTQISMQRFLQLIDQGNKFTLIEGRPGYGKTTLAYKVAQSWAEGKLKSFHLAFVIELRRHNKDSIEGFLLNQGFNIDTEDTLKVVNDCKVLFIFDGVDEVPSKQIQKFDKFITEIKRNDNFYALFTSRPTELLNDLNVILLERIIIRGFSKEGRISFVNQYFEKEIKAWNIQKILEKLDNNNSVKELSICPLMLLLFCLLVENNPEDYELPATMTDLFKQIVNFLIVRFDKKIGKPASTSNLFENEQCKQKKQLLDDLCKFGKEIFKAIKENILVFEEKQVKGDFLVKIGLLIKLSFNDTLVEPFHKSVSEFLCALYLSKLFLEEKNNFFEIFPGFLMDTEKEDSLIIPFLCGLLKEKSRSVIEFIPKWFYFGNWNSSVNLFEECSPFLTNNDTLLNLIPPDLDLSVAIDNNQIVVFENLYQQSLPGNNFIDKHKWHELIVNVHHITSDIPVKHFTFSNLHRSSFDLVRINFPCQNLKGSKCSEKPFNKSEITVLMEEILNLKPQSIAIRFPHCDEAVFVLLEKMSIRNLNLYTVLLCNTMFQKRDIKAASDIILKQNLQGLLLASVNDLSLTERKRIPIVEIDPLIEAVKSPVSQLYSLFFYDIFVSDKEFIELIDCLSKSRTLGLLRINFTSSTDYEVDLSQLCNEGKQWRNVDLQHIKVAFTKNFPVAIDMLRIVKCVFTEQTSISLVTLCRMKDLNCDNRLMKALCSKSHHSFASFRTLQLLSVEDEITDSLPQIVSKFKLLFTIRFDFRRGFKITLTNKKRFISFLIHAKFPLYLLFPLECDSKKYLKQIDFIVDSIKTTEENHSFPFPKIGVLRLTLYPDDTAVTLGNITSLNRKQIDEVLKHLSKFRPFLSSNFLLHLVISIEQCKEKGHYFGPFLTLDKYFPEKDFLTKVCFQVVNRVEFTIKKRPMAVFNDLERKLMEAIMAFR